MDLACKGQYQDALIIHLIYSLSLDPYHIYLLTYDCIIDKNQIQYWDYKSSSMKTCYLYYELWSDINLIKGYQEAENSQLRRTLRIMIDQTKIRGEFIINISPTNIYNRFHRKFWNSLKDFDLTPNDIIVLSKYNSKKWIKGVYNRSLFTNQINLTFKTN